jgi:K+-transporting ATPase ATPase C chain
MRTLRRQLVPAILLSVVMVVICGIIYPFATWAVGDIAFHSKVEGSFVKANGVTVGSKLIGQNFSNAAGDPLAQYFQPRPSDTEDDTSYDPAAGSNASNLGPSSPLLIGFVPGVNTVEKNGDAFPKGAKQYNPFATTADPWCVPMSAGKDSEPVTEPTAGQKYAMSGGSYVCDPDTVPERTIAYREFNHLAVSVKVPVDAVTASASGLDPDISPLNADLQAPRVASARHLPLATVVALVHKYTSGRELGFLGEKTVNVLELNIALDELKS